MTIVVRLIVSLVTGWLAAGATVAVCLGLFSKSQMDYVAIAAVVLGLGVAGVCWRATRSWAPRKATPAELAAGFDVHLGYPFLAFLVLIGIPSLGLFALIFWLQTRRWPKKLDPEGMTLRNGNRLSWKDVTNVNSRVKTIGRIPVSTSWQLCAGDVRAEIVPNSLAEGKAVVEFVSRVLGRNLAVK